MELNAIYHGEPCNAIAAESDMQDLGYSHKITYPNGVELHVKEDEMTRAFFVWWQFDDGVELTAVFPDNPELPHRGEPFCTMYIHVGGHTSGSIREAATMPLASAEASQQMIHTLTRGCYNYNLIFMTEDEVKALRKGLPGYFDAAEYRDLVNWYEEDVPQQTIEKLKQLGYKVDEQILGDYVTTPDGVQLQFFTHHKYGALYDFQHGTGWRVCREHARRTGKIE